MKYAGMIDPEYLAVARGKLSEWPDQEVRYNSSGPVKTVLSSGDGSLTSRAYQLCKHETIHGKSTWNKNSFGTLRCSKCYAIKAV